MKIDSYLGTSTLHLINLDILSFDAIFHINVRGPVEFMRQSLDLLRESKGSIINIGSSVSQRPLANMALYSASKAALSAITKSLARELAVEKIRVNAVSVGPIDSPIYEKRIYLLKNLRPILIKSAK